MNRVVRMLALSLFTGAFLMSSMSVHAEANAPASEQVVDNQNPTSDASELNLNDSSSDNWLFNRGGWGPLWGGYGLGWGNGLGGYGVGLGWASGLGGFFDYGIAFSTAVGVGLYGSGYFGCGGGYLGYPSYLGYGLACGGFCGGLGVGYGFGW